MAEKRELPVDVLCIRTLAVIFYNERRAADGGMAAARRTGR